jgi:dipeptide/tripeptide permease
MNQRRLLLCLFVCAAIALERAGYYGMRSVVWRWLEDGGMALGHGIWLYSSLTTLAPLAGGLVLIAARPAWTAAAGMGIAALGYLLLAALPPSVAIAPLALAALGTGLARTGVIIALASALPEEGLRNGAFAAVYMVINAAAALAGLAAPWVSERLGSRPVFFGTAFLVLAGAGLMVLPGLLARGEPEPPPRDDAGRGAMGILLLSLPALAYFVCESALDVLQSGTIESFGGITATRIGFLVNPIAIAGFAPAIVLLLLVLDSVKVRVSTVLVIGIGLLFAPFAVLAQLAGHANPVSAIASTVAISFGEALVGSFLLSRAASSVHPRGNGLVVAFWLVASSGLGFLTAGIEQGPTAAVAIGASILAFLAGVSLVVLHRTFDETFFPGSA